MLSNRENDHSRIEKVIDMGYDDEDDYEND